MKQQQAQQQQLGYMQLGQQLHRQGMSMLSQEPGIQGLRKSHTLLLRVQISEARLSSSCKLQQQVSWQHCQPLQMPAAPWR
jgi:hypothetical protein